MSRILDGVSTDEVVPLSDPELGAARIGVDVEAGAIRLSYDAVEGFDSLIFPPSPDRPPGLPDRWPFVPGCTTTWTQLSDAEHVISWAADTGADALYDVVAEGLMWEGWHPTEADPLYEGVPQQVQFARAERMRILVLQMHVPKALVSMLDCSVEGPAQDNFKSYSTRL